MKKLVLTLSASIALASASAGTFEVIKDGVPAAGLNYYGWNNEKTSQAVVLGVNAWQFMCNNVEEPANVSGGFFDGTRYAVGPLHSATLNIEYNYSGDEGAKYIIRLTAEGVIEQDCAFEITPSEEWQTVAINVAEKFPEVAKGWNDGGGTGKGYVFALVLSDGKANSVMSVRNVWYSNTDDAWEEPVVVELPKPTTVPAYDYPAENVVSILSKNYPPAATANWENWGQSTETEQIEIDGAPVLHFRYFNYQGYGFSPRIDASKCNYMHVDYWTPNGTTFGFTPISPGQEKANNYSDVKKEEWNSYDVKLSHWDNVDFSDIFQIKYDNGGGREEGYVANVFFYYKEEEEPDPGTDPVNPQPGATYNDKLNAEKEYYYKNSENVYVKENLPYVIDYSVKYNEDKTLTITAKYIFEEGKEADLIAGNLYIQSSAGRPRYDFSIIDGTRTTTTTQTYSPGETVSLTFYVAGYGGSLLEDSVQYTVGSGSSSGGDDPEPVDPVAGASYIGTLRGEVPHKSASDPEGTPAHIHKYDLAYEVTFNPSESDPNVGTLTFKAKYTFFDADAASLGQNRGRVYPMIWSEENKEWVEHVWHDNEPGFEFESNTNRVVTTSVTFTKGQKLKLFYRLPLNNGGLCKNFIPYTVGSVNNGEDAVVLDFEWDNVAITDNKLECKPYIIKEDGSIEWGKQELRLKATVRNSSEAEVAAEGSSESVDFLDLVLVKSFLPDQIGNDATFVTETGKWENHTLTFPESGTYVVKVMLDDDLINNPAYDYAQYQIHAPEWLTVTVPAVDPKFYNPADGISVTHKLTQCHLTYPGETEDYKPDWKNPKSPAEYDLGEDHGMAIYDVQLENDVFFNADYRDILEVSIEPAFNVEEQEWAAIVNKYQNEEKGLNNFLHFANHHLYYAAPSVTAINDNVDGLTFKASVAGLYALNLKLKDAYKTADYSAFFKKDDAGNALTGQKIDLAVMPTFDNFDIDKVQCPAPEENNGNPFDMWLLSFPSDELLKDNPEFEKPTNEDRDKGANADYFARCRFKDNYGGDYWYKVETRESNTVDEPAYAPGGLRRVSSSDELTSQGYAMAKGDPEKPGYTTPVDLRNVKTLDVVHKVNGVESRQSIGFGDNTTTGVREIESPAPAEDEGDMAEIYYTLDGVRVERPVRGLYIRVYGSKAEKVWVR